jgi:hypothetical protein
VTAGPRRATVPALGGIRRVPVPDAIAHDYLLLALRLDQHIPGFIDGYFGPADLKAKVDMEQLRSGARLLVDAGALLARLEDGREVADAARRAWLRAQVRAMAAHARSLAGDPLPYLDHVEACFDWRPVRLPDAMFHQAAAAIDERLPGPGSLDERLAAWDDQLVVPVERLPAVVDWLVEVFRARATAAFGVPAGEELRVSLVTDKPWSGYNWYDGGLRSRVELNTDLPIRAPDLLRVVAHETFPGHHLEHAWKEADLVMAQARLEHSAMLINAPECLLSEGLANLGYRFVVPRDGEAELLMELFERGGLAVAGDRARAAQVAATAVTIRPARNVLGSIAGNAALLRHVDGLERADVHDYLVAVGRQPSARASQRMDFVEHDLWRTYVFVYHEGESLLARWLETVPAAEQPSRFGRLLREAMTPSGVAAELAQA